MVLSVISHEGNAYQNTMKYHYVVKIKIIPNAVEDVEQLEFPDITGGNTK